MPTDYRLEASPLESFITVKDAEAPKIEGLLLRSTKLVFSFRPGSEGVDVAVADTYGPDANFYKNRNEQTRWTWYFHGLTTEVTRSCITVSRETLHVMQLDSATRMISEGLLGSKAADGVAAALFYKLFLKPETKSYRWLKKILPEVIDNYSSRSSLVVVKSGSRRLKFHLLRDEAQQRTLCGKHKDNVKKFTVLEKKYLTNYKLFVRSPECDDYCTQCLRQAGMEQPKL